MDYISLVNVVDSQKQLISKGPYVTLRHVFLASPLVLQDLVEVALACVFHQDEEVLTLKERCVELDHVRMVELAHDVGFSYRRE